MAKSYLYHKPATHNECSYEPRVDTWAIHVTLAQDRICLDYFCRIGVNACDQTQVVGDDGGARTVVSWAGREWFLNLN